MVKKHFVFSGEGGKELYGTKYLAEPSRGAIQIIHGMAEHRERYSEFSRDIASRGYSVYVYDQRGHGETATENDDRLGHLPPETGWREIFRDLHSHLKLVKAEEKGKPIYAFGHSMGSFLVRDFITDHGRQLDGVILSGSGKLNALSLKLITPIAKLEKFLFGEEKESVLMEKALFSSNNDHFHPPDTSYDWLSRDREAVQRYIADELSGFSCTTGFYDAFISGLRKLAGRNQFEEVPKSLKILVVSGEEDPVGGPEVIDLAQEYSRAGVGDVDYKIYPGARHEIIHEINRDEVVKDVVQWLRR
ncbi:MAG: alpha/beta hydrolase [Candidatus Bipolaricaulota bacterium]